MTLAHLQFIVKIFRSLQKNMRYNSLFSIKSNRFLIGLCISLSLVLSAFEWQTSEPHYPASDSPIEDYTNEFLEIPETYQIDKIVKPSAPEMSNGVIVFVEDFFESSTIPSTESSQEETTAFDPSQFGMDNEDLPYEPLPFVSTEIYPHYQNCHGLRGDASLQCSMLEIRDRVQEVFELPDILRDAGGTFGAHLSFMVNTRGEITQIEVLESNHPMMAKAAKEALKKLPPMIPGKQQGKKVNLSMSIPIVVKLTP